MKPISLCWSALVIILVSFACAPIQYREDPAKYKEELSRLSEKLKSNPKDWQTIRDIGIIYFKTAEYRNAEELLKKALAGLPDDPQTLLYLGLSYEFNGKTDQALEIYSQYRNIGVTSPYRARIEGRYHWLARQQIRQEMRSILSAEDQLSITDVKPNTVAVFPFTLLKGDTRFSSLGTGLAEMIITDLSQVDRIQIIERARLSALLEEMALGQTGLVEEQTAPRFGKLLGAGKLLHGNFSISEEERVRIDAAVWDIKTSQFPTYTESSDLLNNFFQLEKDLVYQTIDRMGIQLTFEEKQRIQRIPTKNMQSFLAYCQGLELKDAGNFEGAHRQFEKAVKLDPGFNDAKTEGEKAETADLARGSKDQFINLVGPAAPWRIGTDQLINNRLKTLNLSTGSNFIPGEDSRAPGEEASYSGVEIGLEDLPDPPGPPVN